MAWLVEKYLQTKANVILKNGVTAFLGENGSTAVKVQNEQKFPVN